MQCDRFGQFQLSKFQFEFLKPSTFKNGQRITQAHLGTWLHQNFLDSIAWRNRQFEHAFSGLQSALGYNQSNSGFGTRRWTREDLGINGLPGSPQRAGEKPCNENLLGNDLPSCMDRISFTMSKYHSLVGLFSKFRWVCVKSVGVQTIDAEGNSTH